MDIFYQKKITTRIILFLVVLNLLLVGCIVWKNSHVNHPLLYPKNEEYRDLSGLLKKELLLSDTQAQQFDAIREDYFNKETELKQIIKNAKDAMNEEMYRMETNHSKVIILAREISMHEYKMELLRYNQAQGLKAVCNPQQLEKFEHLIKEIRDYCRPDNQPIRK